MHQNIDKIPSILFNLFSSGNSGSGICFFYLLSTSVMWSESFWECFIGIPGEIYSHKWNKNTPSRKAVDVSQLYNTRAN